MILGFSIANIILWAVFGLIVGYIVHLIDPQDVRGGILGTVIIGLIGAWVGGVLSSFIFGSSFVGYSLQGFVTAIIGGLIFSAVYRFLFRTGQQNTGSYTFMGTKGGRSRRDHHDEDDDDHDHDDDNDLY